MPQNDQTGKGRGESRPGRARDPDSDPREIRPDAAPEAPLGEQPAKGSGSEDPRTEAEVQAELQKAQSTVDALTNELAGIREENQRGGESERVVAEFKAQREALVAEELALEKFRNAELKFLADMLPEQARKDVAEVEGTFKAELAALAAKVDAAEIALDAQKAKLDGARGREAAATARLETAMKPVEAIRAKLKDAAALRTATNKAEEENDFARAFWLVMDNGRLQQRLKDVPIPEPKALREEIGNAQKDKAAASADIAAAEAPIAALTKALEQSKADHDKAKSTLEERILKRVSELNPQPAEPA